jgi:hypothetical protein
MRWDAKKRGVNVTQVGIALEDIVEIADFSNATMLALATRLEHSSAFQALIAREIELDELWRRLETGLKTIADDAAARATRTTLAAMFDLVWQAHDLAGAEQPLEAAARLRQACALRA